MSRPRDEAAFACDERFPAAQVLRLLRRAVVRHDLDLRGLRVLTEAGVGYRRVAPVLAALAGADEVYAIGRDTPAASRREADEQTAYLAELAGVAAHVKLFPTRLQAPLATVDIVTDLPGVRPIDEAIVRNLPASAVVALMRGTAYWRPADVDAASCRRGGVAVAGVDEDAVDLYRYLAVLALWGLLRLGVEVVDTTIVVAGGGAGLGKVVRGLSQAGARVLVAAPEGAGRVSLTGGRKAGDALGDERVRSLLAETDALVLCAADPAERTVTTGGWLAPRELAHLAPHLAVVSLSGEADGRGLAAAGLRVWSPQADARGAAPDLLPQPVIELYAAGLKVGQVMARARRGGSSPLAAEQLAALEAHGELLPKDLSALR